MRTNLQSTFEEAKRLLTTSDSRVEFVNEVATFLENADKKEIDYKSTEATDLISLWLKYA